MLILAILLRTILDGLCTAIGAHLDRDRSRVDILTLAWTRIGRATQRFARLYARFQADTLPRPRPSRAGRPRASRAPKPHFPTRPGWLVHTVGFKAANHASQLAHLLARPDLAAFLAAAPQAGRLLRPLCRMLGVDPPAPLALPPRPRKPRKPRPPAPPRAPIQHGKYTPAQIRRYSPGRIPRAPPRPA